MADGKRSRTSLLSLCSALRVCWSSISWVSQFVDCWYADLFAGSKATARSQHSLLDVRRRLQQRIQEQRQDRCHGKAEATDVKGELSSSRV